MLTKIKTITSHAGHARFLSECDEQTVGYLAKSQVADIPSPYAYSPSKAILRWNGKDIVVFETRHKRFEVFEVPATMIRYSTDELATEAHIVATRCTETKTLMAPSFEVLTGKGGRYDR